MPYVVTAMVGKGRKKKRENSIKFRTKKSAEKHKKECLIAVPGCNPRVKKV